MSPFQIFSFLFAPQRGRPAFRGALVVTTAYHLVIIWRTLYGALVLLHYVVKGFGGLPFLLGQGQGCSV